MHTDSEEAYDLLFKIILIGDYGVGKTNVLSRFTQNLFDHESKSTEGVFSLSRLLKIEGQKIKVDVWDTAGLEKFSALTNAYYREAVGALLIYDITRAETFQSIKNWLSRINEVVDVNIICSLIGNKSDLKDKRQVSTEEAEEFAKKNKFDFFETSASDSKNIDWSFKKLIIKIYYQMIKRQKEREAKEKVDGKYEDGPVD